MIVCNFVASKQLLVCLGRINRIKKEIPTLHRLLLVQESFNIIANGRLAFELCNQDSYHVIYTLECNLYPYRGELYFILLESIMLEFSLSILNLMDYFVSKTGAWRRHLAWHVLISVYFVGDIILILQGRAGNGKWMILLRL